MLLIAGAVLGLIILFLWTQETNARILALNWCKTWERLCTLVHFLSISFLLGSSAKLSGRRVAVMLTGRALVMSRPLVASGPWVGSIAGALGRASPSKRSTEFRFFGAAALGEFISGSFSARGAILVI
jgi:hypothetical protein